MARVKGEIPYDVRRKKFKYNRDVSDGETLGSALIGGGGGGLQQGERGKVHPIHIGVDGEHLITRPSRENAKVRQYKLAGGSLLDRALYKKLGRHPQKLTHPKHREQVRDSNNLHTISKIRHTHLITDQLRSIQVTRLPRKDTFRKARCRAWLLFFPLRHGYQEVVTI